jgi:hypothetical protein
MIVLPCLKITDPVGVGPDAAVTVAVKVTDWPTIDGFSEDSIDVVVAMAGGRILKVAVATGLCVSPLSTAIALIVVVAETAMGAVYFVEEVVGTALPVV